MNPLPDVVAKTNSKAPAGGQRYEIRRRGEGLTSPRGVTRDAEGAKEVSYI
jgi:hypothetical protein